MAHGWLGPRKVRYDPLLSRIAPAARRTVTIPERPRPVPPQGPPALRGRQGGPAGGRPALPRHEWLLWLLAALAARLLYGWLIHPRLAGAFGWIGDDGYDEIARLWLGGRGYVRWPGGPPTLERLPLYPLFLAAVFKAGGARGETLAYVLQSALSTLALLPLGALAGRLAGVNACRAALVLGLAHPIGYVYNFRFMSEPLHLALVAGFLWLAARWIEEGGAARAAACGAALGAALVTRSSLAPLAPVLLGAAALARAAVRNGREAGRGPGVEGVAPRGARIWRAGGSIGVAAAACVLVLAPWLWRARALGGGLMSSGSAAAAYHGLAVSRAAWQGGDLGEVDRRSDQDLEVRLRGALPGLRPEDRRWEAERERVTRRLVWGEIAAHPWHRLVETFRNLALAWYLTYTPRATAVAALFQVPLLAAVAVAARRRGRRWPPGWWPALILLTGQTLLQALFYPHFRFMGCATWVALALAAEVCAAAARGKRARASTLA